MNWYRHPYSESRYLLSLPYFNVSVVFPRIYGTTTCLIKLEFCPLGVVGWCDGAW